jgi:hypothetical protein
VCCKRCQDLPLCSVCACLSAGLSAWEVCMCCGLPCQNDLGCRCYRPLQNKAGHHSSLSARCSPSARNLHAIPAYCAYSSCHELAHRSSPACVLGRVQETHTISNSLSSAAWLNVHRTRRATTAVLCLCSGCRTSWPAPPGKLRRKSTRSTCWT